MFCCPECKHTTKTLRVFGWLVYGEATLNRIESEEHLSAIVPHISINAEGFKSRSRAECLKCGFIGALDTFSRINTCYFTGKEGTRAIDLFGKHVYVHEDIFEDATRLSNTPLEFPILEVLQGV